MGPLFKLRIFCQHKFLLVYVWYHNSKFEYNCDYSHKDIRTPINPMLIVFGKRILWISVKYNDGGGTCVSWPLQIVADLAHNISLSLSKSNDFQ